MELMIIKQLPIIEEKFRAISEAVKEKTEKAKSLVCTAENLADIRKVRATLNKEYAEFENKRKEIKSQIMKPYDDLNATYKEFVGDIYTKADADLKEKIETVSNEIKTEMETNIKTYFKELCEAHKIDFVTFEQLDLNITLSASEKSLKEDVSDLVNRYVDDLALIETQENKSEILVEYKKSLNVSQAIRTVSERLKAIEEEKKRREAREAAKVEEVEIPVEEPKAEPEATPIINFFATPPTPKHTTFKITVSAEMVDEIKFFLDTNDVEYEVL